MQNKNENELNRPSAPQGALGAQELNN